jgi:hypothetical protein
MRLPVGSLDRGDEGFHPHGEKEMFALANAIGATIALIALAQIALIVLSLAM